jgi:hypothetical protein
VVALPAYVESALATDTADVDEDARVDLDVQARATDYGLTSNGEHEETSRKTGS